MRTLMEEMKAVVLVKNELQYRKKKRKRRGFFRNFLENWFISISFIVSLQT